MYTFNDHGNRASPLSPKELQGGESFIEHKQYAEVQPTKYYYDTDCFRYEKPWFGRLRHFHQFGIEVFGTPNMLADSEVICRPTISQPAWYHRDRAEDQQRGLSQNVERSTEALKEFFEDRDMMNSATHVKKDMTATL